MPSPGLGFPGNRRDGARQLSIVTLIGGAALTRIDHPLGQVVLLITIPLGLYWWKLYRQLRE
ncbi:MAG: hypothetical protein NTW51_06305 [Cyanobacteria bacterium]|nr:hypothetical protein [Cyanobacteriota bacterium]